MISEIPAEVLSFSRTKHKSWNKGGKADIVVCGKENPGWCDEVKCEECKKTCFYSSNENLDMKKRNVKKICVDCILDNKKYRKYLNKEQIKLLEIGRDLKPEK